MENQTFQSIPSLIPIEDSTDTTSLKDHFILSKSSCFISQYVLNLSQVLTNCCAARYNICKLYLKTLNKLMNIITFHFSYFAAFARVPVSMSNISQSQSINFAYKLLTRSRETCHVSAKS